MNSNPCKVCGGTDLNLVDGFYYCAECGTQDVNVRETIVEATIISDGTYAFSSSKKLTTVLKEAIEMSGEWNKWHAYNFILAGLTDELINLGAKRSLKTAVLWIWTKYIKMFQVKEVENAKSQFIDESLNENENKEDDSNTSNDENNKSKISNNRRKNNTDKFRRDIKIVTKGTLLAILYSALNLDKSDIQLSHLMRFIKEGRVSFLNCTKFVPKEINTKLIPHWNSLIFCRSEYTSNLIRTLAMTLFKRLDLGRPLVPNLNKMICNYIKELCLPNEFKNLVFSLMNLIPCDFLNINRRTMESLVRIPDYEGVCMSYVLVAMKMCFGLDSEYELKVSDQVDRINYAENYLKSYKLGSYSGQTDRLFSFQEWYTFLLFRRTILCKYYLPMARLYKQPVDDFILMEHFKERCTRKIRLMDSITMDILNKITIETNESAIPVSEFPATLTPMYSYTDVILQYLHDPDLRLLLSEDFSQYSLKYAINELNLSVNYEDSSNIIQGISETNKCINPNIVGTLKVSESNKKMVFVRNFENKHWLTTKPPTTDHVIKVNNNKNNSDKDSDHGYESNLESTTVESDETTRVKDEAVKKDIEKKEEMVLEIIEEECEIICIFDDNFDDFENKQENKYKDTIIEANSMTEFRNDNENNFEELDFDEGSINTEEIFNPKTFDRESTIKKLLEMACTKYKIKMPVENEPRGSIKRKNINQVDKSEIKRNKYNVHPSQNEPQTTITDILQLYYTTLENDILHKVSEEVKTVIHNQECREIRNDENFENNDFGNLEMLGSDDNNKNEECFNNEDIVNDKSASVISSVRPNLTINSTNSDTSEDDAEDLVTQSNPKFDVSTHDIEQLYVKLGDGIDFSYNVNYETDPQLDEIIDKPIDNFTNNEIKEKIETKDENSDFDSDDDIPLSEIAKEKILHREKINRLNAKYECLVSNPHIQKFNYWRRHYRSRAMTRNLDMLKRFDIEITENCPKSFVFVIRECAAIIGCSTFNLYKCMQNLEESLVRRFGTNI